MIKGGPHTLFAPHIELQPWKDVMFLGHKLADADGALTKEGLCVFWTIASFIGSFLLYYCSRYYSPLLFSSYRRLSRKDKREWDVRYSSMIHSFLCVWYAHTMLWKSDFFFKAGETPHLLRTHAITYTELGISLGYFVVDFFVCLKYHMGGAAMVAHHVGTLAAIFAAIFNREGHILSVWILVTEFTTPFINFRWWMEKAGMKTSPLYILNGIAAFLAWIAARIVIFPPFFYVVYKQREQIPLLAQSTQFILYVFPVALFILNLWWFYRICKGLLKVLGLGGTPKVKAA